MAGAAKSLGYDWISYALSPRGKLDPGDIGVHWSEPLTSAATAEAGAIAPAALVRAALTMPAPLSEADVLRYPDQRKDSASVLFPLHGPGQAAAALALGSARPQAQRRRLWNETVPIAYLLSTLFNARVRELSPEAAAMRPALSERERDCLRWAAHGKTSWEIARILCISESAVKKHLAGAAEKLKALTRTHAVAIALMLDLI